LEAEACNNLAKKVDIGKAIRDYLKKIYPHSATKKEILSGIGVSGCAGESWFETLVASREIVMVGKQGRQNLYQYKK
jgi:hypothetical protein